MKRWLAGLLAALLACAACGTAGAEETLTHVFEGETSFSMTYPAQAWVVIDAKTRDTMLILGANARSDDELAAQLAQLAALDMTMFYHVPTGSNVSVTMQAAVGLTQETVASLGPVVQEQIKLKMPEIVMLSEPEQVSKGDNRYLAMVYEYDLEGTPMLGAQYFAAMADTLCLFTCAMSIRDSASFIAVYAAMDRMLETFMPL